MRKDVMIVINLEPPIKEAYEALAQQDGLSASKLGRRLIIDELRRREVLPDEVLTRLLIT